MKLVSLNICIKQDNLDDVMRFLDGDDYDIMAFQESTRHFEDTVFKQYQKAIPIKQHFAATHPYDFFAPLFITPAITKKGAVHRDFGGLVEQGTQIVSRYPIVEASNRFYYNHYAYGYETEFFREKDWTRSVLVSVLDSNGKKFKILNVHGIWNATRLGNKQTLAQCRYILEAALEDDMPTIIVGDFNLLPESEGIRLIGTKLCNLATEYKLATTRPSFDDGLDRGDMVVDYIFVSEGVTVNDFYTVADTPSDHLPLVLDFDIL